jgi:prolyl-tRNA synthetase
MRGVPIRLELGPKDVEKDQCVLVRRDTREKAFVPLAGLGANVTQRLAQMQSALLDAARARVQAMTSRASSYDEFKQIMSGKRGFIVAGWNGDPAVEARIKEETKATIRVMPLDDGDGEREAPCIVTGQKGREVYFAQAY